MQCYTSSRGNILPAKPEHDLDLTRKLAAKRARLMQLQREMEITKFEILEIESILDTRSIPATTSPGKKISEFFNLPLKSDILRSPTRGSPLGRTLVENSPTKLHGLTKKASQMFDDFTFTKPKFDHTLTRKASAVFEKVRDQMDENITRLKQSISEVFAKEKPAPMSFELDQLEDLYVSLILSDDSENSAIDIDDYDSDAE